MDTTDYHYYNSFDEIGKPFYDWERQIINLGCNVSDIDINNTSDILTDEGRKYSSKLVHEYIHYLQNFSTGWGAPVFTDFTLAIMKIGASSAESKEILNLPLVKSNLKSTLLIDGINLREAVINRVNKFNSFDFHSLGILRKLELTLNNDVAVIANGRVTVELGLKVIREHMANLGTQLFLGLNDDEIHNYNKTVGGFKSGGIEFSDQPEYWILFEYFYKDKMFTDLAKGVFHLTQQCLITLNPESALLRFLRWFNNNKYKFSAKLDFTGLVEDWLKEGNEIYFLHVGSTKAVEHCERVLALTTKHLSRHDIFRFTHNITEYALNNIRKTTGGRFLFVPSDNFANINYWKIKITEFGTGIVRYLDNTLIHGSEVHCRNMTDSFNFLVSSSLVVKQIVGNQKANCPFMEDIPICKAECKGDNNCYSNPFLMVKNDGSGKECLFANGVLLTGMENRVNFNS